MVKFDLSDNLIGDNIIYLHYTKPYVSVTPPSIGGVLAERREIYTVDGALMNVHVKVTQRVDFVRASQVTKYGSDITIEVSLPDRKDVDHFGMIYLIDNGVPGDLLSDNTFIKLLSEVIFEGMAKLFKEFDLSVFGQDLKKRILLGGVQPLLPSGNSPVSGVSSKECSHEFKTYFGFSECYDYCVKCDKKKPNPGAYYGQ